MKVLRENDFKAFEQIVKLSQPALKYSLSTYLRSKYQNIIETDDYLLAEGNIPIALVAHMDTVFSKQPEDVFYDTRKNVIWSPQGLGADDRAGVFAILQIIKSGLRPHVIFTTDEEMGCVGASVLAEEKCPFKDLRYIIELDRRGSNDCVFYDCDNADFEEYVEKFGFITAWGSFSDISMICPSWKIAGVNLSVGYRDEHSISEILNVGPLLATIEKVKIMLTETEIPSFEYIETPYARYLHPLLKSYYGADAYDETERCYKCHKAYMEEELYPVRVGDTLKCVCPSCIGEGISWCDKCFEAYDSSGDTAPYSLCPKCRKEEAKGVKKTNEPKKL